MRRAHQVHLEWKLADEEEMGYYTNGWMVFIIALSTVQVQLLLNSHLLLILFICIAIHRKVISIYLIVLRGKKIRGGRC